MEQPKGVDISVILCTYNRSQMLGNVLRDLALQVRREGLSCEVLVIDNNSTDDTRAVVEQYERDYPGIFRYLFEERQGKTFALNTGVGAANGAILAFTDDDVLIPGDWLQSIETASKNYPACRAFGGKIVPHFADEVPSWIVREGALKNTGGPLGDYDLGDEVKSCREPGMYVPCGANMFFRRGVFEDYGGFDEDLNLRVKNRPMSEDTEFCERLARSGEEVLYIPSVVVQHRIGRGQLTKGYFMHYSFKGGRSAALNEEMAVTQGRLFNVPGYLYKIVLVKLLKCIWATLTRDQQRMMSTRLSLAYYTGLFYELLLGNRNFDRVRR